MEIVRLVAHAEAREEVFVRGLSRVGHRTGNVVYWTVGPQQAPLESLSGLPAPCRSRHR